MTERLLTPALLTDDDLAVVLTAVAVDYPVAGRWLNEAASRLAARRPPPSTAFAFQEVLSGMARYKGLALG